MKWTIDNTHSRVEFAVKHLMISTVKGHFAQYTGSGETTPNGVLTAVAMDIDVASIDTGVPQRDDHLRSPDFFDAATQPKLTFRSTKVVQDGTDLTVTGDLMIRGTTKPVTLKGDITAIMKDPWGNQRAALSVTGKLNRKDWGLVWNMVLETGGLTVGEEVKLSIDVEAVAVAGNASVAA